MILRLLYFSLSDTLCSIRAVLPHIIEGGVECERKYSEGVVYGNDMFVCLKKMLGAVVERELAAKRIRLEDLMAESGHASLAVFVSTVLSMVSFSGCIDESTVPKTLLFDQTRLVKMQGEYNRIVNGFTIIATVREFCSVHDKQKVSDWLSCMFIENTAGTVCDVEGVVLRLFGFFDENNVLVESANRIKIRIALELCIKENNPVRLVM